MKTYWFSKKQGELLDVLGRPHNFVYRDGEWTRYTLSTDRGSYPGTWPDFEQVASGDNLPTKSVTVDEEALVV